MSTLAVPEQLHTSWKCHPNWRLFHTRHYCERVLPTEEKLLPPQTNTKYHPAGYRRQVPAKQPRVRIPVRQRHNALQRGHLLSCRCQPQTAQGEAHHPESLAQTPSGRSLVRTARSHFPVRKGMQGFAWLIPYPGVAGPCLG